jgi:menaquinone-dependent protoporphyrinogen IX oxidase
MNSIIVYGSNYGTTKQYADELSRRTNMKVISFKKVNQQINDYDNIIYLGALYAGGVLGMSKTLKKLNNILNKKIIIVTVGLSDPTDEVNKNNIRNNIKNQISREVFEKAKIFHLRGGIDYSELNFAHKTMMKLLYNAVKNLPKEKLTAEDRAMIETYNKNVNFIDFSSLDEIISETQK